jgi:hypothetical protein
MDAFLAAISAFPTSMLSVLMIAAMLYWLLVIVGALDLDLLHLGDHDVGHDGGDHDAHAGHNPNAILEFLRVGQVPITIIVSVFVFVAWSVSLFATVLVKPILPDWSWWVLGLAVLAGALIAAFVITGIVVAPLAKLFSIKGVNNADDLIGKMVEVTSSTVDARYGTARYDRPTGEDVLLNVTCEPHHTLKRGEQAVVMDYDRAAGTYRIAPLPHTRPGFADEAETSPPPAAPAQPEPPKPQIPQ